MPNELSPLAPWLQLLRPEHASLVTLAEHTEPSNLSELTALRKQAGPELARIALALAEARQKAKLKFPAKAQTLVADPTGVEQASGHAVANHKASRLVKANVAHVIDLCCGIGGDAMAMTDAGLRITAVDQDPVRAWMAAQNANCHAVTALAQDINVTGQVVHIDPARRNHRGRIFKINDYVPSPESLRSIIGKSSGALVKLSPGVSLDELDDALPPGQLEFISENGRLVQALLWTGDLVSNTQPCATLITQDQTHTLQSQSITPPIGSLDTVIHTADPAVERAGLLGCLCEQYSLQMPHPALGLLTGPEVVTSPWLKAYRVIDQMPWRLNKVQAWLRHHDAGIITVKTRGKAADPDEAQKQLRGLGDTPYTVFIHRWDLKRIALITQPIVGDSG